MAQASFQWRNLVSLIQDLPHRNFKRMRWQRWSAPGGWLLVTGGAVGLLFWNGRLVVATSVGVAIMMLVYLLQDPTWKPWRELQQVLKGWNKQFVLAVSSGSAGLFGTYLAASMWAEAENHWIATGMIVQGTATFGMLGLLLWQMMNQRCDRAASKFDQILVNLTHEDPLKRLIAVRQMSAWVEQQHHNPVQQRRVADYLRVMLSQEKDTIVREAILEGLQVLDTARVLPSSRLQPLDMKKATLKSPARNVDGLKVRKRSSVV